MTVSESGGLIPGLDPPASGTDPGLHTKEESEAPEGFLQVWLMAAEDNDSPVPLEGSSDQKISFEGNIIPAGDKKGQKGIEALHGMLSSGDISTGSDTTDPASQAPLHIVDEKLLRQTSANVLPQDDPDGDHGKTAQPSVTSIEASALLQRSLNKNSPHRDLAVKQDPSLTMNPDQTQEAGGNSNKTTGVEVGKAGRTQEMEGPMQWLQLGHDRNLRSEISKDKDHPLGRKFDRQIKAGTDSGLSLNGTDKETAAMKSLSLNGSGGGNSPFGTPYSSYGREGFGPSSIVSEPPVLETFSAMMQVDTKLGQDQTIPDKIHGVESRLPEAFSTDKILLRQVAEKLQFWRPHHGDVIRFRLEPETLGMLQLDIAIHERGIVADIVAEHQFVKTLLETNQNQLHEMLSAKGLNIDRFSVNVGTPNHPNADQHNPRKIVEVPRSSSEQEEGSSLVEGSKARPPGDYRVNLYV